MTYEDPIISRLGNISPSSIRTYLSEKGWEPRRNTGTANIYRITCDQSWDEVSIPNSTEYSDYSQLVYSAIRTISKIESRTFSDVVADIISGNASEGLQYRLKTDDDSGTVPLDWIMQILQSHKMMSAVAYLDLTEYQPFYRSTVKGTRALKDMRMGQTSYGSYVVRFTYPFPSEPQRDLDGRIAGDPAVRGIAEKVLTSARTIVESAIDNVEIKDSDKISFNFVDSFMTLKSERGLDLEMSSTGSNKFIPSVEVPDRIFKRVEVIADSMRPKIESSTRSFTGRLYSVNEIDYDESISKFKVEYFDDEGTSKAFITLDGTSRKAAIQSLSEHKVVSFEGKVVGYGNSREIKEVSNFRVIGRR